MPWPGRILGGWRRSRTGRMMATTIKGLPAPIRSTAAPDTRPASAFVRSAAMLYLLRAGQALAGEGDAPPIHSGIYEGLMLAVAPDGAIQGSFREQQGEGVVKSCAFFLSGKLSGAGGTSVVTWAVQS